MSYNDLNFTIIYCIFIIENLPVSSVHVSKGGVNIWLIVALCCSAIVVLIIGVILIFIIKYKDIKRCSKTSQETEQNQPETDATDDPTPGRQGRDVLLNQLDETDTSTPGRQATDALLNQQDETVNSTPGRQETDVLLSQQDPTDNSMPGRPEIVVEPNPSRDTDTFLTQRSQSTTPPHYQRTQSTPAPESSRDPSLPRPSEFNRDKPSTVPFANSKGPEYGKYIKRNVLKLNYNLFF